MIAFGCAITDHKLYHRCAEPGINLVAEPDSKIIPMGSSGLGTASIFRNYNLLLEEALKLDDLELLVLIHQDAEIVDPNFCAKVREGLRDPEVGVLGCAGAVGVRNIAWWDGSVTLASFSHRYLEYGGGDILGSTFHLEDAPPEAHPGEVDTIDGFMMALPPWTIENIRFDESLGQFHGYDFDLCQQIRTAGKKVMAEHIQVIHHHSLDLISDIDGWIAAHMRVAEKWEGRLSPSQTVPGDWKERARWAEARRDAALMKANEAGLVKHAAMVNHERVVQSIEQSASWRLTKPLRWLKSRLGRDPSRGGENRATIADEKTVSSPPSVDGVAPVPWSADQK
jgi:Glycosyltransferase like family